MIAVIDYGVGNLFSLCRSLEAIGQEPVVTGDPALLRQADKLFLPGVGAFADAAAKLRQTGLDQVILEEAAKGKPLMGICLGMQLLFDESLEFGQYKGLGLIPGRVVPMEGVIPADYKIPHIGWNAPGGLELFHGVQGVRVVDRHLVVVPLIQAHSLAAEEVDGGKNFHLTSSLRRMFSGWPGPRHRSFPGGTDSPSRSRGPRRR